MGPPLRPSFSRERHLVSTQDLVLTNLRQWLVDGTLRPGSRIQIDAVAKAIGCSIIPVREALRTLEKENLVTILPNRGVYVKVLSPEDIAEIYWVRQTLEARALRRAVPKLQPDDWDALDRQVEAMDAALGDLSRYLAIDLEFHHSMYRDHNPSYLVRMIADAYHASDTYRLAHAALPDRAAQVNREHKQLVQALRRRDADDAEQILRQHLSGTAEHLIEHVVKWKAGGLGNDLGVGQ